MFTDFILVVCHVAVYQCCNKKYSAFDFGIDKSVSEDYLFPCPSNVLHVSYFQSSAWQYRLNLLVMDIHFFGSASSQSYYWDFLL
jgi:hypothetical protein